MTKYPLYDWECFLSDSRRNSLYLLGLVLLMRALEQYWTLKPLVCLPLFELEESIYNLNLVLRKLFQSKTVGIVVKLLELLEVLNYFNKTKRKSANCKAIQIFELTESHWN